MHIPCLVSVRAGTPVSLTRLLPINPLLPVSRSLPGKWTYVHGMFPWDECGDNKDTEAAAIGEALAHGCSQTIMWISSMFRSSLLSTFDLIGPFRPCQADGCTALLPLSASPLTGPPSTSPWGTWHGWAGACRCWISRHQPGPPPSVSSQGEIEVWRWIEKAQ